jgi:uncharacterized coiled-coil protein SlyX
MTLSTRKNSMHILVRMLAACVLCLPTTSHAFGWHEVVTGSCVVATMKLLWNNRTLNQKIETLTQEQKVASQLANSPAAAKLVAAVKDPEIARLLDKAENIVAARNRVEYLHKEIKKLHAQVTDKDFVHNVEAINNPQLRACMEALAQAQRYIEHHAHAHPYTVQTKNVENVVGLCLELINQFKSLSKQGERANVQIARVEEKTASLKAAADKSLAKLEQRTTTQDQRIDLLKSSLDQQEKDVTQLKHDTKTLKPTPEGSAASATIADRITSLEQTLRKLQEQCAALENRLTMPTPSAPEREGEA